MSEFEASRRRWSQGARRDLVSSFSSASSLGFHRLALGLKGDAGRLNMATDDPFPLFHLAELDFTAQASNLSSLAAHQLPLAQYSTDCECDKLSAIAVTVLITLMFLYRLGNP